MIFYNTPDIESEKESIFIPFIQILYIVFIIRVQGYEIFY